MENIFLEFINESNSNKQTLSPNCETHMFRSVLGIIENVHKPSRLFFICNVTHMQGEPKSSSQKVLDIQKEYIWDVIAYSWARMYWLDLFRP